MDAVASMTKRLSDEPLDLSDVRGNLCVAPHAKPAQMHLFGAHPLLQIRAEPPSRTEALEP